MPLYLTASCSKRSPRAHIMALPHHKGRAYITLITRASYLPGVITLAYTLKKHRSEYPLVVLHPPNLHKSASKALELESTSSNIILRQCDLLHPPEGNNVQLVWSRFEDTWTKLRVFEVLDYDTLCFLDADMIVLGNMDFVFSAANILPLDHIAATHDCTCNIGNVPGAPTDWNRENCTLTRLAHHGTATHPQQPNPDHPEPYHSFNSGMFLFHRAETSAPKSSTSSTPQTNSAPSNTRTKTS